MKKFLCTAVAMSALVGPAAMAGGHLPLEVADQSASTSVTISVVNMDNAGFVTIHGSNASGEMIAPASLGHTYVDKGSQKDVVVNLATAVSSGTALYAMLHNDDGKKQVYEFGVDSTEFDGPYMHDGGPVVTKFIVK